MLTNLYAYTEPGQDYPAYVSINRDEHGAHTITVRSRGDAGRNVGVIDVTPALLRALIDGISSALHEEWAAKRPNTGEPLTPREPMLQIDGKSLRERIKTAHND